MDAASAIRIKGSSDQPVSSDAVDFYKDYWVKGSAISRGGFEHRRAILDYIFPSGLQHKRIIELGVGGEGGLIDQLRDTNEIFGFDASRSAVELCRQRGLNVTLMNLDIEPLPFPDQSIDIVLAMEVFEHFASPQSVLEQIQRVMGPGGIVLISTPNPLICHWPRLFYPELFRWEAFRDLLMINRYRIEKTLGSKCLPFAVPGAAEAHWHWIWVCSKLDQSDPHMLFEYGRHFWNQKDPNGFRQKPVEAIDFFSLCHQLRPEVPMYRFYLARSLAYRFINGEIDEFSRHYHFLVEMALNGDTAGKREAWYHLAMIYLELDRYGNRCIPRKAFADALEQLGRDPQGGPYLEKILQTTPASA